MNRFDWLNIIAGMANTVPAAGPKPGTSTTEFWLTAAVSLWGALSPAIPPPWNIAVPLVATTVYTLGRSVVKLAHGAGRAQRIGDLPDLTALVPPATASVALPSRQ